MKALTVIQPWASLIATGEKEYETRHWKPSIMKKGDLLAIHAGKRWTREEQDYCRHPLFRAALERQGIRYVTSDFLPLGAVLAIAQLVAVWKTEDIVRGLTVQERAFGNYQPRRYAWQLKILHRFDEPFPASGEQSLWDWQVPVQRKTVKSLTGIGKCGDVYYDRETGEVVDYKVFQPPLPAAKPAPVQAQYQQMRLF